MEEDFESAEEDFESDTEEDFKQRRRDGFSGDQVWPSRPPPPPPFQSQSETICIWWEYLFPAPDSFLTPSYPRSPPPLLQPSQSPSPLPRSPVLQSSSSSLSSPSPLSTTAGMVSLIMLLLNKGRTSSRSNFKIFFAADLLAKRALSASPGFNGFFEGSPIS
ncbi:early nodulin-20-like [Prosopis cineraria]|uniref:early nodulin-20-like n=1 Tax=Prosopis cineraria TaxID=364024 RepID=UPI00240EADDE|nr:early nodulin-20-like [Prosopis cineraria]